MSAEEVKLAKDRSSLDRAHELKNQANDEYQRHNYPSAIRLYHECLLHAKAVNNLSLANLQQMARQEKENKPGEAVDLEQEKLAVDASTSADSAGRSRLDSTTRGEEMKDEARDLIAKCYNNLAACILNGPPRQPADYLRAADYCDNVLTIDANNEKAFFRKGCALMKATKYDPAIECFKKCPKNAVAEQNIIECKQKLHEDKKRRDEQIRANFAKARAAEEQRAARADGAAATNGSAVNGNVPH